MKLLNIVLYISLYFSLSKAQEYVIKQNDTCYDIINMFNIYNNTFYEINPLIDCNNLKINETINIFNKDTIIITKQDLNGIKSQQC